ncbi:MAG: SulP family inorganic anion transporter [Pseudomonadota bacterium]
MNATPPADTPRSARGRGLAQRLLPFLRWWPMDAASLRGDIIAGISVALVLVPQSMAYAQLAGMPAYYGLYAGFLPVIIAALWGSSNQLATGPAAVCSILTAAALAPLAATGSEAFVAYAILLAFLVGAIQLALGLSRLGSVVNFLSHPVIVGFTSAAAIIIGLSQVNKLLGLPIGRGDFFLGDIAAMLRQLPEAHLPSVAMGTFAMAVIWACRRWLPRWPGVLVAVALTTAASAWIGFERVADAPLEALADPRMQSVAAELQQARLRIREIEARLAAARDEQRQAPAKGGGGRERAAELAYEVELATLERDDLARESALRLRELRSVPLVARGEPSAGLARADDASSADGTQWRIRDVRDGRLRLSAGGEVVGYIPPGLPAVAMPAFSWEAIRSLLASALVIALVGFVESISIAKSIAARTRQRIDANQELVGQGLANLAGSFTQAFPTIGSFSRSAVNFSSGARSGLASVITGLLIMATLLALTPLLYHLPQAVLAGVIIMAVANLVSLRAMHHAWVAHRHDGIAAWCTFVLTLLLAPAIDYGVLAGAALALGLYLYRTMRPRATTLAPQADGTLVEAGGAEATDSRSRLAVIGFEGSLYFANVHWFEDVVLETLAARPQVRAVLVVGDGIGEVDASGVDALGQLAERLRASGVTLALCSLRRPVIDVLERTGTAQVLGADNLVRDTAASLAALEARMDGTTRAPTGPAGH